MCKAKTIAPESVLSSMWWGYDRDGGFVVTIPRTNLTVRAYPNTREAAHAYEDPEGTAYRLMTYELVSLPYKIDALGYDFLKLRAERHRRILGAD